MQEYAVVVINGTEYKLHPRYADVLEYLARQDNYNPLFELAFDWYKMMVHCKGKQVTRSSVEVG